MVNCTVPFTPLCHLCSQKRRKGGAYRCILLDGSEIPLPTQKQNLLKLEQRLKIRAKFFSPLP